MAITLRVTQPRLAYVPWLQKLQDFGDILEVRGRKTLEILDAVTEVKEPWHHCILLPSRRWNPWLALSEVLWILAGRNDVAALLPYNSNIVSYSDDGISLYGAYGKRIYDQIDNLIERLRKDPSDRRAVLQIWDCKISEALGITEKNDLITNSKDPPCNNMVYFKLRQNKLHMTVMCRSNDLHWGLFAVNLPTFGILQSYIAARLGVDMGTQTHLSNSLHIYTDEPRAAAITDRMLYTESEDIPKYPEHNLTFTDLTWIKSHEQFAEICSNVLDDKFDPNNKIAFLDFAYIFLTMYRERVNPPDVFDGMFVDWLLAGKIFANKVWK